MKKRTIGILATSVAVSALCVITDASAIAGGKGGGGGWHGGGGGGGWHGGGGGGFHGFAAHGGMSPMGHGGSGHALSAHGWSHRHTPPANHAIDSPGHPFPSPNRSHHPP